ncbi:MAG: LamG domain-containing protein [Flavobacteriaceae bacterium]|nr:LamG domain-containing protein [Flavobacteriaceae bacterium]
MATEDIEVGQLKLGLIAYFPFSGNAIDSSSNGNNGTVKGATLTNDRFNKNSSAYLFSNSSDHSITGTFKTVLNEIFTISFWVKRNNNQNTGSSEENDKEWIFASGNSLEGGATNIGLSNNSSELRFGPWGLDGTASGHILNNSWQNIVQTYSNGEFQLFVNGKLLKTIKSNVKITNGSFSIGCQLTPFTKQGFDGAIDDVRIHNRVLTQKEIEYLATH